MKEKWVAAFEKGMENAKVVYGTENDVQREGLMHADRRNPKNPLDKYSEKEYNNFGWARANGVLSVSENADLRSKFAAAISKHITPPKTKNGEFMFAIGDEVENKIAYMKGQIDDPIITRILEINEYDEKKLSETRRETYALERRGIQREAGGLFRLYTLFDFPREGASERRISEMSRYNNQFGAERGRGSKKAKRNIGFKFNEDGTITTKYSDGTEETSTIKHSDRRVNQDREILARVIGEHLRSCEIAFCTQKNCSHQKISSFCIFMKIEFCGIIICKAFFKIKYRSKPHDKTGFKKYRYHRTR